MERVKESILLKILIALSLFYITIVCFSSINAASYYIDDYKIDAKVLTNGNMHVIEYLKYNFSEDMNGLIRNFMYKYNYSSQQDDIKATSSRYQASNISNINVFVSNQNFNNTVQYTITDRATNGTEGVYTLEEIINDGYRKNIRVYSPVSSGNSKYVKYEYDIEDVAVKYNDVGEIYWNFIGKDWDCDINNFTLNVSFEGTPMENATYKVYPHSYTKDIGYEVSGNNIIVTAKDINPQVALDTRIVFPSELLISSTKVYNENYNFTELEKIEKEESLGKTRYLLANKISAIAFVGGLIGLFVIIFETNKIVNKGKKKGKNIEICTEMLDKYSLGEYSSMLNSYGAYTNNEILLATILDLSNREFIIMEPQKKLEKEKFSKIEYNYMMRLNSDKNYSTLNEYEISIINYLFNGKVGNLTNINEFEKQSIELNDRIKEISKSYTNKILYAKTCDLLNKKQIDTMYDKAPKKLVTSVIILILIYFAIIGINLLVISPVVSQASTALAIFSGVIGLFAILFISSAKSLKEEYTDEYNRLVGLKKYLTEYSVLKERYPIEMALWDKYLVFASLFGVAKTVAKEFREELIAKGYDDDYIYANYFYLNLSMHSLEMMSSFATSMGTGSSSSGGYSGSGSGGGGGRRWRRRCLLR